MLKVLAGVAVLLSALAYAEPAEGKDQFKATLSGDEEVPPVDTDTSGKALLSVNKNETEIEFQLRVNDGEGITQAHIHCGVVGQNGPVVAFLAGSPILTVYDVDGKWISNATITNASIIPGSTCGTTIAELVEAMRAGEAYVNVHSVANPAGEVRGQIQSIHDDDD